VSAAGAHPATGAGAGPTAPGAGGRRAAQAAAAAGRLSERVIWHELECGRYAADLGVWRRLARRAGGPVLDVGAGSGRVALALAGDGHEVTAVDVDGELLARLSQRARSQGLTVRTLIADARRLALAERFSLCVVPMQTIQLLGGARARARFLRAAAGLLLPGGLLGMAIVEHVEAFDAREGAAAPAPDAGEHDGVLYLSRPVAVRVLADSILLERVRERVQESGGVAVAEDRVKLARVSAAELERECAAAGLRAVERIAVPQTDEHAPSTVVVARG